MAAEGPPRHDVFDSGAALLIVRLPAFRGSLRCGGDLGDADFRWMDSFGNNKPAWEVYENSIARNLRIRRRRVYECEAGSAAGTEQRQKWAVLGRIQAQGGGWNSPKASTKLNGALPCANSSGLCAGLVWSGEFCEC